MEDEDLIYRDKLMAEYTRLCATGQADSARALVLNEALRGALDIKQLRESLDEDADLKYGDAVQYLLEYREIPYDRRPECSEELLRVLNRYANPNQEG